MGARFRSRPPSALAAESAGGGIMNAFAPNGTVGAGLVGAERMVAAYNSTRAAVAKIMKSDKSEGGNLTARAPGGDGVFTAGFNSAVGGGDACVYPATVQSGKPSSASASGCRESASSHPSATG